MKKGDLRKQEILKTAETLFCKNGYEKTSVQDILDILHASKGSFYHHFISKESLLEAMFEKRAEQALNAVSEPEEDPVRRVDRMLCAVLPLQDEQLAFLLMLLPIFSLPEGRSMKTSYCDALARSFRQQLAEAVANAAEAGMMLARDPQISAEQCLLLVNRLWIRICEIIVENENAGRETDAGDILHLTEAYRRAVEQILTAPYGSVTLMKLTDVKNLTDRIHTHWKNG